MRSDAWLSNLDDRLRRQLTFLVEVDRLKTVLRDTPITDGSRLENSAEHSWHLALFAMTLAEFADQPVDVNRVVRMLTIHDIVEIDAGDLSVFRQASEGTHKNAEGDAAHRLFGLLPEEMADEWIALWQEFEAVETADARFARAIDSVQPLVLNHVVGGGSWTVHDIDEATLRSVKSGLADWAPRLWPLVEGILADAVAAGWLARAPGDRGAVS
jgi:putative hydrolase of HD superfamily